MCGGGIGRRLTIKGDEIMDKLDQTKEKSSACQECETYKFAIMKASKALFYETLRCISVLAFVAVLAGVKNKLCKWKYRIRLAV